MVNDWFVVHDGLIDAAPLSDARAPRQRISVDRTAAVVHVRRGGRRRGRVREAVAGHSRTLDRAGGAADGAGHGAGAAPLRGIGDERRRARHRVAADASGGAGFGSGSFVSLLLLGPMMDVALRTRAERLARVCGAGRCGRADEPAGAGLACGAQGAGSRPPGARPFDSWWLQASVTYTLSGVVAGLLGAFCWFHFNDRATARDPAGVIYVGIDDTDIIGSPAPTSWRARSSGGSVTSRRRRRSCAGTSCSSIHAFRTPARTARPRSSCPHGDAVPRAPSSSTRCAR